VCDPVVASFGSGAINAIGGAAQASQANEAKRRDYEYKLKIREQRWMRDTVGYKTKKIQYKRNISEANLAAQRAYTQSQINLNNVRSQAMLDHSEDFKSMLEAQGMLQAKSAERGVGGGSVLRTNIAALQKMGMANSARARALTETNYRFKEANEGIRRKLMSEQNREFSKVAISPVQDIPPPQPVMQNPGMIMALGLAGAAFDAGGAYAANKPPSITDNNMFTMPSQSSLPSFGTMANYDFGSNLFGMGGSGMMDYSSSLNIFGSP